MAHPLQLSATVGKVDFAKDLDYSTVKDRSVLITGGASGLGALIAKKFGELGARITIADIQKEQGQKYAEDLQHQGYHVTFVCTDVTSWESQVKAFKAAIAHSQSGESIDIVVAGAGLRGNAFKNSSEEPPSLEKDPKQPTTDTIDVNLTGLFFTAKLAHYYFRIPSNSPQASPDSKALILMGSVAGYLEVPFVADYNATKWAVRGIFRSIREPLAQKGIRVNMIAPWVMDTPMSTWLVGKCKEQGLLVGNPDSVTEAIIRCAADDSISGRALCVAATQTFDLRDDAEGIDAGLMMKEYHEGEIKGFSEKIHAALKNMS